MAKLNGSARLQDSRKGLNLSVSRQRRGISLEQIADRTKISMRFLIAIEAEEYEKLPGGIFALSYLRQYAASVGIDEGRLLSRYQDKCGLAETLEPGSDAPRNSLLRWLRVPAEAGR